MSPSTSTHATNPAPTYKSLGVRPIINCRGTYTIISGSRVLPQVAEAMVQASNSYVQIDALMEKVGERLAGLTGAEWGYVTNGCASTLFQVTAACVAGANPEKMARLPETDGMRNEVIMQKGHRNSYDRAILLTGAKIIEVVTEADMLAAISERTAMVAITGDLEEYSTFPIPRMIEISQEHNLPTLVDAAAQRPDRPNRYLEMGADVVAYSGGKCLRGPQASGLVLGRKDILQAAFLNGAPHHGAGRPMKAGKEEIMGLLAAVECWYLGRDHEAEWRMWEEWLETIRASVANLPSITTEIVQPGLSNHAPNLLIRWDPTVLGHTPANIHRALYENEPFISMHLVDGGLRVMPYMMETGDAEIVAQRLPELLGAAPEAAPASEPLAAPAQLAGSWQVEIQYILGQSTHAMTLTQVGAEIRGTYRSQYDWTDVVGSVVGDAVTFSTLLGYQANKVIYRFKGHVESDVMRGTVDLGEYWEAEWYATRIG